MTTADILDRAREAFARHAWGDAYALLSAAARDRWVRQRGERIIPIVGVRKLDQLQDILGSLDVELSAEQLLRLDEASRIELGFPYDLLRGPEGQMVYGDFEPQIELPRAAPYRWHNARRRRRALCHLLEDGGRL
jgi:hypothetical protein